MYIPVLYPTVPVELPIHQQLEAHELIAQLIEALNHSKKCYLTYL